MFGIGPMELLVILLICLLMFGAKRLPELGGSIGDAIKNFKKAMNKPDSIDVTPEDDKKEDNNSKNSSK